MYLLFLPYCPKIHFGGAFTKLRTATISFVMSIRLSVRMEKNLLPADGFKKKIDSISIFRTSI